MILCCRKNIDMEKYKMKSCSLHIAIVFIVRGEIQIGLQASVSIVCTCQSIECAKNDLRMQLKTTPDKSWQIYHTLAR